MRAAFHQLVELDLSQRAAAIQELARLDPAVADELRALLSRFDETDLLANPERAPPSRVGPFALQHRLGRGGMGEVFLAERVDGGFAQQVALKLVREAALSPELSRRFLRERQILARLQHPNIAHLVDGGVTPEGRLWLAMEYVEGLRITAWCHARDLAPAARVRLFLPVCDAVQFAHRNLVVHCDLKPANLLVDAEGRPRLLDFGIARLLDADESEYTRSAAALTPAYAAPEQLRGDPATTATDVYQLGVVLRELVQAAPEAPGRGGALLAGVLARATASAPGDRYASVGALSDDLHDWLDARPLRSGIGRPLERLRQGAWQWRWPLAMFAVAAIALGGGAVLAMREARTAQARATEARANLDALLSVIGSANPGRYAGREPLAGELLVDAAARLQQRFANDPGLLRRALSEIGHGLINLGHGAEAEPILAASLAALDRETRPPSDVELGVLKLLVLSHDGPGAAARAGKSAARISAVAARPGAERGQAIDTLSSAAGSLARHGDFAGAESLLVQADALDPRGDSMDVAQRENFWRQRGWVALRAMQPRAALDAFARSRSAHDEQPTAFSAVRRAELDLLIAEAALLDGDLAAAEAALSRAQPAFDAEYPEGHAERAHVRMHQSRLALLRGEDPLALDLARRATAVLRGPGGDASGRDAAERMLRIAQARAGDCADAGIRLATPAATSSPRDQADINWVREELRRACGLREAPPD